MDIICAADGGPTRLDLTGEIDRSDPGDPVVHLECGCNELWLDATQAQATIAYLQRVLPQLKRGGEDG